MNATDEYKYLWDGSEPGWVLTYINRQYTRISLRFDGSGPDLKEIKALRAIIPAYSELSPTEALTKLRGIVSLEIGEFESKESRRISYACRNQGLEVETVTVEKSVYLPVNELTNISLVIEDDEISREVCTEALRFGLPVRHIEI